MNLATFFVKPLLKCWFGYLQFLLLLKFGKKLHKTGNGPVLKIWLLFDGPFWQYWLPEVVVCITLENFCYLGKVSFKWSVIQVITLIPDLVSCSDKLHQFVLEAKCSLLPHKVEHLENTQMELFKLLY